MGPRKRLWAILLAFVFGMSALSGALAIASLNASDAPHASPNSPFSISTIGVEAGAASKACVSVTTCNQGIAVAAFSTVVIGITVYSTTAPSAVAVGHAGYTVSDIINSVATAPVDYIYAVNNVAAEATLTAYVNFTGLTYYVINVADFTNTVILTAFTSGSYTTSGTSTVATCLPSTSYTGELIYAVVGVQTTAEASITPGTGMATVGSLTATTTNVVTQNAQQGIDSATGEYTVSATLASSGIWQTACIGLRAAISPTAPTSLASGSVTTTTVPLTWTNYLSQAPGWITGATVYWANYVGSCGAFSSSASASSPYTSYTVTTLTAGNYYCFYVVDSNTTGASIPSTILSGVQTLSPPLTPTNLVAQPQPGSTTQINLAWTAPSGGGQTSYTLDQWTNSGCSTGEAQTTNIDSTATTYLVSSLTAGTTYGYTLVAVNANGNSAQSNCSFTTTFATPSAPTGLSETATTSFAVTLAWVNPVGANLYNDTVFYQTSACSGAIVAASVGVADAYTVTGLAPYTVYCFYVQAWSGGAHSLSSTTLDVTTLAGLPSTPTNFQESAVGATTVTFIWTNPSPSTGSFTNVTMYWNSGGSCGAVVTGPSGYYGTWTHNINLNGSIVSTYAFAGLTASTQYTFSTALWTQGGQGAQAGCVTYSTVAAAPTAPTGLTYTSASHTSVSMSWTNPVSFLITSDTISYTTVAACASGLTSVNLAGPTTTSTIGSLTAATTYYWEVYATDSGGNSPYSSCVTGATQSATPPAPYGLTQVTVGATFASLTWINPAGYSLTDNIVYVYTYSSGCTGTQIGGSPFDQGGVDAYYQVTGLVSLTTYCIKVTAVDAESPQSAPLIVTTNSTVVPVPGSQPINYALIGALVIIGVVVLAIIIGSGSDKKKKKRWT